jgi:CHAD domain-containing protein
MTDPAAVPKSDEPGRPLGSEVTKDVDPEGPVGPAVRRALAEPAARLLTHEDAARSGDDPEAVHQARVAVRRLRAGLATLKPLLAEGSVTEIRSELRWLGRVLGRVRDADVLLERVRSEAEQLPPRDRRPTRRLLAGLENDRDKAHDKLARAMRGLRFAAVREAAVALSADPRLIDPSAPAKNALGPLMEERWRALEAACRELGPKSGDDELHRARILAKRARYAAEAFAPVFGKNARRFGRMAAGLQDALGAHQDAAVAQAWLRRATGGAPRNVAFVAGELFAIEQQAREDARAEWPRAWRNLSTQGPRFWT